VNLHHKVKYDPVQTTTRNVTEMKGAGADLEFFSRGWGAGGIFLMKGNDYVQHD